MLQIWRLVWGASDGGGGGELRGFCGHSLLKVARSAKITLTKAWHFLHKRCQVVLLQGCSLQPCLGLSAAATLGIRMGKCRFPQRLISWARPTAAVSPSSVGAPLKGPPSLRPSGCRNRYCRLDVQLSLRPQQIMLCWHQACCCVRLLQTEH